MSEMAATFWKPRVSGATFGAAAWALLGFFNGVSRPRVTVIATALTAVTNIVFNDVFIFHMGLGVAGSGWATTWAQASGLVLTLAIFLSREYRERYRTHLTWRPSFARLLQQLRLGLPMGLLPAADLLGFSLFQMMQVRLGTVPGAATQMVMSLTSISYMPGFGIAQAGITLVGQSIGAGDRAWAMRVGSRVIVLAAVYMGAIGVVMALAGPWILPLFADAQDPTAIAAAALGIHLLWIAAAYQFFDGLNMASGMCLRGAGDATVPAALVLPVSLLFFVPLAHALTFAPGQGWVSFLPQFGWGAYGGWAAVLSYLILLGPGPVCPLALGCLAENTDLDFESCYKRLQGLAYLFGRSRIGHDLLGRKPAAEQIDSDRGLLDDPCRHGGQDQSQRCLSGGCPCRGIDQHDLLTREGQAPHQPIQRILE